MVISIPYTIRFQPDRPGELIEEQPDNLGPDRDPPICTECVTYFGRAPALMEWLGRPTSQPDVDGYLCPLCGFRQSKPATIDNIHKRLFYDPPRCSAERWATISDDRKWRSHSRPFWMSKVNSKKIRPDVVRIFNFGFLRFTCAKGCKRRLRVLDRDRRKPYLFDIGKPIESGVQPACTNGFVDKERLAINRRNQRLPIPTMPDSWFHCGSDSVHYGFDLMVEGQRYLVGICRACRTPYYRPHPDGLSPIGY